MRRIEREDGEREKLGQVLLDDRFNTEHFCRTDFALCNGSFLLFVLI